MSIGGHKMKKSSISRRDFLKGAAASAVGIAAMGLVSGCGTSPAAETTPAITPTPAAETPVPTASSEPTTSWKIAPDPIPDDEITATYDVEIGIIGLGHAGLAVYRAAAEKGANVLAIEAQPRDTWWTYGHDIGHINSKFLKDRGVPDVDPIDFYNAFMIQAHGKANPHIVMDFAKNSGDAIDWYLEAIDQETIDKAHVTYWPDNEHTIKELSNGYRYFTGTAQWWEDNWAAGEMINHGEGLEMKNLSWANYDYVEANYPNAACLFDTKGVQLVKDDSGAVTGFIAQNADGYIKVNASKGLVLAGGGFGANNEMCHDLIPQVAQMFTPDEDFAGMMDRDGSTIQMGYWVGGRIEGEVSSMNFDSASGPDSFSALWLDKDCKRFQDEAYAGPEINGLFAARAKRGSVTAIYDSTYDVQMLTGHPGHGSFDYSVEVTVDAMKANFEAARTAGAAGADNYYCADTLDELADMLGYDEAHKKQFLASIEEYNAVCTAGKDTDFGKDPHFLFPVTQAPFYAHVGALSIGFALVTTGGFVTTDDYQVVDSAYEPISGLYATGNTCGMRFGPAYITPIPGLSIGMCITLGRLLGEKLASM
ncbi:MAG: FAD-binding protein [Bacilli bacterium]|nr:FAD-binding protein [Bacilli bacterium]